MNVRYPGSDPLALALSLHKGRTKEILAYRGVPTAPFACVETAADLERLPLAYPVFVKPIAEGSGKGIFVTNPCETERPVRQATPTPLAPYARAVLVPTYLPGAQFTTVVLCSPPRR